MNGIRWSRVMVGVIAGFLADVLLLGGLIAILIAFTPAQTIQEAQSIPRYGFAASVITALAAAWGAFFALRTLTPGPTARHNLHGLLIGFGAGLLPFIFTPGQWVANLITLLMCLPAAVLGSRLAERSTPPR
jgi:hypothetical protein